VSVSLALGQDVPRVVAHEDTLRRAVIHLIANAAESMEAVERTGVVEVSVEASGRHVVLVVEDTGKGMPREVLEGVFSPFFSTKGLGKGKGYGLNLALMRKAAEDWGGQMEIFSREGQGTRVTLRLAPVLAVPGMP
jgi:signal transduction histidine kinase